MKNSISVFILLVGLLFTVALVTRVLANSPEKVSGSQLASVDASVDASANAGDVKIAFEQISEDQTTSGSFFAENWGTLVLGLLGFFDVVARLTPSAKDNSIVNLLSTIINAIIPNFRKGGGRF